MSSTLVTASLTASEFTHNKTGHKICLLTSKALKTHFLNTLSTQAVSLSLRAQAQVHGQCERQTKQCSIMCDVSVQENHSLLHFKSTFQTSEQNLSLQLFIICSKHKQLSGWLRR